jgi:hypothetical protein
MAGGWRCHVVTPPVGVLASSHPPPAGGRSYFVFLLTITPALKLVSRFGWLRTHSE